MRIWTAHEKPHAASRLVREGFSLGAAVFGPFWLAAHRAWVPAAIALLLEVLIAFLPTPRASLILFLGFAALLGFSGRDLVRWSLARRGYAQTAVVAARSEEEAESRLFTARPDLAQRMMVAETAP